MSVEGLFKPFQTKRAAEVTQMPSVKTLDGRKIHVGDQELIAR